MSDALNTFSEAPGNIEFAFSGREREFSALQGLLEKANQGRGNLVFIAGEAGVGKTKLASEVWKLAKSRGFTCLTAKCPNGGSLLPYSVWVELLRGFFADVTVQEFLQLCGNLAVRIMRLLPELGAPEPSAVPLEAAQGQLQSTYPLALGPQVQIFDALTQFFVRVSGRTPILLVLDDFQWCDQASLDLLQYLSGSGFRNHSLLILCAFRDTSLEVENTRLQRFLSDLPSSENLALSIHLDRFDSRGSARLVQSAFGSGEASDEICEVLHRRSGGNPFFMKEMLRLLAEKGAVTKGPDGQWRLAPDQVVDIPKSAKDIMRQRLAYLDSEAVDLLRIGAFVGEEFDLELLKNVSKFELKERLLRLLEKAVALGLIEERLVKGESVYKFSDEVVMEVLVEKLGFERLRSYHLTVAEALEQVYAVTRDEHASALALHYQMARNPKKCFEYSVKAGDRASRVSAHRDASRHYATALVSLDEMSGAEPTQSRGQLLERLGHAQWLSGQAPEAYKSWSEAVDVCEKTQDLERAGALHRRIGYYLGTNLLKKEEAFEEYKKSLEYLTRVPKGPGLAQLYFQIAELHMFAGEFEEAKRRARMSISLAKEFNFHLVEALANAVLGASSPISEGEDALRLLQVVDQFGPDYWLSTLDVYNPVTAGRAYAWLAIWGYASIKGDSHRAGESFDKSALYAKELGSLLSASWPVIWRAEFVRIPLGEWAEAKEELADISRVRLIQTLPVMRGELCLTLGTLYLLEGELDRAEEYLKEGRSLVKTAEYMEWFFVHSCQASLGRLYIAKGEYNRAEDYLKEGYRIAKRRGFVVNSALQFADCAAQLVDVCLLQGKEVEARGYLEELRNLAGLAKAEWSEAYHARAAGAVASHAEEWEEAHDFYQRSAEYWKKLGWPYELAVTYQRLAAVHQEKGEIETANQTLERALDIFKRLGANLDVKNVLSARTTNEEHQDASSVVRLSGGTSERSRAVFKHLSDAFLEDYFAKRHSPDVCGWRSLSEIAHATRIPVSSFYQADSRQSGLAELERSGLVETRVFLGQRGRGGKITRVRIAFDREEIKQFISKRAGKKSRSLPAVS